MSIKTAKKRKCVKCTRMISLSNIKKHELCCNGILKKNIDLPSSSHNGKYRCPHCNNEYSKSGIKIHIWRMHTKEGREFDPNCGYKEGIRQGWSKGQTKETNKSLQQIGETYQEGIKSGKIIPFWKGKHHTQETKDKISKARIEFLKEHPDMVPYKLNHSSKGRSYPEQYFYDILTKEKLLFEEQYQIGLYQLDFAFVDKMIDLEIDGDQHYLDKRIVESDKRRTKFLENKNWKVIRVKWSDYQRLEYEEKEKYISNLLVRL